MGNEYCFGASTIDIFMTGYTCFMTDYHNSAYPSPNPWQ